tara:strand:+ start:1903 stop:2058 length:156 start_codon:yes stop_codon:yes gene_type:complete
MKKTKNKYDIISPTQEALANVLKIASAIVFLSIWTPGFIWVIIQVIKLITK